MVPTSNSLSVPSNDYARRNAPSAHEKDWQRAEREIGEFAARRYGGTPIKLGENRDTEDIPRAERDAAFWARCGLPDWALAYEKDWQPSDGYIRNVSAVVEVKTSGMRQAAGWFIPLSQWEGFRSLQLALEREVVGASNVEIADDLDVWPDEACVPFFLALQHSDAPNLVAFLPWQKAERIARKAAIPERDGSITRKMFIAASDLRHAPWVDMATGQPCSTPAPVLKAVRDASASWYIDLAQPSVVAWLEALDYEAFEYIDPAAHIPNLVPADWSDVEAIARSASTSLSRGVASQHEATRVLAERDEIARLTQTRARWESGGHLPRSFSSAGGLSIEGALALNHAYAAARRAAAPTN